ncbi:hypothetical protein VOLCADRAFT_87347 [Volvox carteri f. nagariensis]|uniref:Uncharacterized protein n=1 Tax=Volvox carteri f. nagariensis TaxID=3068 RepID=D8TL40_VOLCA|nr:uncharacterized protein VOLCADRAFT_87347 [Volvox carteri f. nagariensis]EFJ51672.1 hypothetical protein VOLCADRAFT_87347 [Volvox carteri f. nagariensis]|eukprot:XP_002947082.1 hypothetical protein VOLCADRAFT_87347 [Volvox carteri f. nagariensis]
MSRTCKAHCERRFGSPDHDRRSPSQHGACKARGQQHYRSDGHVQGCCRKSCVMGCTGAGESTWRSGTLSAACSRWYVEALFCWAAASSYKCNAEMEWRGGEHTVTVVTHNLVTINKATWLIAHTESVLLLVMLQSSVRILGDAHWRTSAGKGHPEAPCLSLTGCRTGMDEIANVNILMKN